MTRVERVMNRDHRRLRVEPDRARQHERAVRELHDRQVDPVRLDDPVVGDPVPEQVEVRSPLEGPVREQVAHVVAVRVLDPDRDPLARTEPEPDVRVRDALPVR